ncbi:hypothetical protein AWB81_06079 [Caballeronia arationis]|nr:hypothetical protein AWB81_06079 [Caballeronia arationis]
MGAMSRPSRITCPDVGSMSRLRRRTSVDFPEPESPMMTKISPALTARLTSSTATMLPVCAKISLRPRPCFRSSAARSGLAPKIFERFLTVRISVLDAAMERADDTAPAWIAAEFVTSSGVRVRFGIIGSFHLASMKMGTADGGSQSCRDRSAVRGITRPKRCEAPLHATDVGIRCIIRSVGNRRARIRCSSRWIKRTLPISSIHRHFLGALRYFW